MGSYTWNKSAVKWLLDKCKATFLPKDQFKEAYLGWGGKDINSDISPIDAAMSSLHNANRSELCNPAGVTIEYTRDKGATWTDYGSSDAAKVMLLSYIGGEVSLGKTGPGDEKNTNIGLRITLDGEKMDIYAEVKKLLINFNTNGATGCTVKLEYASYTAPDTWRHLRTSTIRGWSGWNSYPIGLKLGSTSYGGKLRMTFFITGLDDTYPSKASVFNVIILGPNAWGMPSNLAKTGHLYSYDWQGNATFPNGLTAKTLNGHTLNSDVPAGAKFTDTTYGEATQSANGLMSSGDKKKLDGLGKPTVFSNIQVAASAWKSGASAAGSVRTRYADVTVSGVTANQFVQVVFNPGDIDSYNLASICTVGSGKITIYAESAPGGTMTIPTIVVWPA